MTLLSSTSAFGQQETVRRLLAAVAARGMTVFARFDHAAAARTAGLSLRPTEVVVFGDPRAGTLLMQAAPTLALELPLRILVLEGADGTTTLVAEEPAAAAARHGTPAALAPVLARMTTVIEAVMADAGGRRASMDTSKLKV